MTRSRTARWFLVILLSVGIFGWIVTGQYIYARLAYTGLLLVLGSAAWTVLSLRGIRVRRTARSLRASVGEIFEEHYEIKNRTWPGCFWLEVLNRSDLPLASGSRVLTRIGPRQRRFYVARTLLTRRGSFSLGPTQLASGDPFGLFTLRKVTPAQSALVVLPMSFQIRDFPPPPGILPGGKAIRQRTSDVTPHAAGVREYMPGDPMKRIHWPSTAHRQRFMVKEFEQDPQADIWIFLDAQREIRAAQPDEPIRSREDGWWLRRPKVELPRDTFEYAVSASASMASYFLAQRKMVGLVSASSHFTVVSAERGERQMNKIMETLAFLKPDGEMPITGLIQMQAKLLPVGAGVILVTSNIQPDLLLAVEDLQRRHLQPVVVLVKPESFGGQGSSELLNVGLLHRSVPVCQVSCGDDLAVQLALPVVYFQRSYLPRTHFTVGA